MVRLHVVALLGVFVGLVPMACIDGDDDDSGGDDDDSGGDDDDLADDDDIAVGELVLLWLTLNVAEPPGVSVTATLGVNHLMDAGSTLVCRELVNIDGILATDPGDRSKTCGECAALVQFDLATAQAAVSDELPELDCAQLSGWKFEGSLGDKLTSSVEAGGFGDALSIAVFDRVWAESNDFDVFVSEEHDGTVGALESGLPDGVILTHLGAARLAEGSLMDHLDASAELREIASGWLPWWRIYVADVAVPAPGLTGERGALAVSSFAGSLLQ